jgi:hypothetical protein
MKNIKQKQLDYLSSFFLKFNDPDEAFYETNKLICRLNNNDLTINDIQYKAYQCKKEVI